MNITPHTASLPLATVVNPPTDGLRRDNHQREIITQVAATNPSAAEKSVASEKERAKTPAQTNEQIDFTSLRKQAEHAASAITDQEGQQSEQQGNKEQQPNAQANVSDSDDSDSGEPSQEASVNNNESSAAEERLIQQLQHRDKEVRAHELAHASSGGASTGAPSYTFEIGPDGKRYAVGGEVSVDLSSVAGDPQATIAKMKKVHSAALAPANPSSQDIKVAASATQKILAAQSELLALNNEEASQLRSANNDKNLHTNLDSEGNTSDEFDRLINQTLSAQESIITNANNQEVTSARMNNLQSNEVIQRAGRIESFYATVKQGYEKPENFQFELTA